MTKPWRSVTVWSHHVFILSWPLLQTCANPKTRPSLLTDKAMEPAIKYINKKFPNIDFRGNIVSVTARLSLAFSTCLCLFFMFYFVVIMQSLLWDVDTKRFVCSQSINNYCVIHWRQCDIMSSWQNNYFMFTRKLFWQVCLCYLIATIFWCQENKCVTMRL